MDIQINFADTAIIGSREEQQDYMANLIIPQNGYLLYVLADGMGGQIGGATASKTVTQGFLEFFKEHGEGVDPIQNLKDALAFANNKLTEILRQNPNMNGMGTTIIAMLYHQQSNRYWFLSVGDSPLYKSTANGIVRLNANHAYYEDLLEEVRQGKITQQEADEHPQRHAITSAVMGKAMTLIDTRSGTLQSDELILMASDGVQTLNDLPGGELEQILRENTCVSEKIKQVIQSVELKNNPYQDNTTLILIEPVQVVSSSAKDPKTIANNPLDKQNIQPTIDSPNTQSVHSIDHTKFSEKKNKLIVPLGLLMAFILGVGITSILTSNEPDPSELSPETTINNVKEENVVLPAVSTDEPDLGKAESQDSNASVPPPSSTTEDVKPTPNLDASTETETTPSMDRNAESVGEVEQEVKDKPLGENAEPLDQNKVTPTVTEPENQR